MECEVILDIQQKLQRLYDVLSTTLPVKDLGNHPFTVNAKRILGIASFIDAMTEEALAEKASLEEQNQEIIKKISEYCTHLQLPIPEIKEADNVMLQRMNLENELSRIGAIRSEVESEMKVLESEINGIKEWLGCSTPGCEGKDVSLETVNYLRSQLLLYREEKVEKEAKRQEYYDEIEKYNSLLKIKSEFTLDESIGRLKDMADAVRTVVQKNREVHSGLLSEIKKRAAYLGIEPERFSDSIDDESLEQMKSYAKALKEDQTRMFDSIFEKARRELLEINGVFGIETPEYPATEESLDIIRDAIGNLLPKKDLFCEILSLVEKRQLLLQKMTEFEKIASDPKRLFRSSFQLNTEEKFRNTAYPSLLKLEEKLFELIEKYEQSFGRFCLSGQEYKVVLRAEVDNRIINRTVFISRCDSPYRKKR